MGVKQTKWRKNTWIDQASFIENGQEVWVDKKGQDTITGYIVASEVEKNSRPLAWVFAGNCRNKDGSQLSKQALADRLHTITDQAEIFPYLSRKVVKTWYCQQMQHY
jgi:hypothetical protein